MYKTVVGQKWLKTTQKVHACDLRELEWTNKSAQGDGVTEDCSNPLTRIVGTTKQPARSFQLDRITLVLGPWLPSRPVIDSLVLPLMCGGNPKMMVHCSVRLRWLTGLDLVNGRRETFMGLVEAGQGSVLKT